LTSFLDGKKSDRKGNSMRYILIGIVTIAMAAATPAVAQSSRPSSGEVTIEIVSGSGSLFRTIPHQSFRTNGTRVVKSYLEAKKGENYGIVIRNNTPERIGAVIAVDGRNIISGEKSGLKNSETMYIVNGYESARYDGWRTGQDQVHKFYFTEPADSYSIKTFADSSAMGVIALAIYREKEQPQPRYEENKSERAPAAPSAGSAARSKERMLADESAGTGFGDAQYSPVVHVQFEPERAPVRKILVKYEWRDVLCRKGLLRCGQDTGNRLWDEDGYAPFPPGYPGN
jgi:hypothetical protein